MFVILGPSGECAICLHTLKWMDGQTIENITLQLKIYLGT